jgi:hypothetical protein
LLKTPIAEEDDENIDVNKKVATPWAATSTMKEAKWIN